MVNGFQVFRLLKKVNVLARSVKTTLIKQIKEF